jgi:hypothetical protein
MLKYCVKCKKKKNSNEMVKKRYLCKECRNNDKKDYCKHCKIKKVPNEMVKNRYICKECHKKDKKSYCKQCKNKKSPNKMVTKRYLCKECRNKHDRERNKRDKSRNIYMNKYYHKNKKKIIKMIKERKNRKIFPLIHKKKEPYKFYSEITSNRLDMLIIYT